MQRRSLLLAAPALLAATAGQAQRAPKPATPEGGLQPRRLAIRHARTGARFAGPYHDGRAPDPAALRELSVVLADATTERARPFDPRALDFLWEAGRREGMEEFVVLSGYRTPVANFLARGAGDSFHLRAAALDLELPAARLARFAETAMGLGRGGVGIYARRGFVHLDSGPVRRWGGGGPAEDRIGRMAEAWAAARPRR